MSLRIRTITNIVGVLAVVCFAAVPAFAQRGVGGGMGRGGMGGGRGGGMGREGGRTREDGNAARVARDSILDRRGYAAVVLDHKGQLDLSDEQVTALVAVDSQYHAATDTVREQLDSLHAVNMALVKETEQRQPGDTMPADERDSVIARRKQLAALSTVLRTAQQDNKTKTIALLTPVQQQETEQFTQGDVAGGEGQPQGGRGGRRGRGGRGGGGR